MWQTLAAILAIFAGINVADHGAGAGYRIR
jgi:hypothetical protein